MADLVLCDHPSLDESSDLYITSPDPHQVVAEHEKSFFRVTSRLYLHLFWEPSHKYLCRVKLLRDRIAFAHTTYIAAFNIEVMNYETIPDELAYCIIKNSSNFVNIEYFPEALRRHQEWITELVPKHYYVIFNVPNSVQTYGHWLLAVKTFYIRRHQIPSFFYDEAMCLEVFSKSRHIADVPFEFQTHDICVQAKESILSIDNIRPDLRTRELLLQIGNPSFAPTLCLACEIRARNRFWDLFCSVFYVLVVFGMFTVMITLK